LILALAWLALLMAVSRPLSAQSPPSDPLAFAAEVGLNQAWYVQHGYADASASLPPIAPAHFPTPPVSALSLPAQAGTGVHLNAPLTGTFDHYAYLPLVQRNAGQMVEFRALWVTRWDYDTVTDVQTLVANAAAAGFNVLLFQVRGNADAFYTPGLEPWAARLSGALGQDPGWDPLQTAIEAAHAYSLEVHAYVNVYPVWAGATAPSSTVTPEPLFWTLSHRHTWDDWRPVDSSGVTMTLNSGYLWATPALTDVVDRVISVTADLVTRYDVDGIHLDLVRYAGKQYSYDPFSNAGYAAANALDPALTRAGWQRRQVTLLVSRVYSEVAIPLRRDLRLSAAVWPVYQDHWGWGYSQGYGDYYQDSQGWMQAGVVDAIMPMIYPADAVSTTVFTPTQFALLASDFLSHADGRPVFPGISAGYADFNAIAQRVALARNLGAPGHAIFSARLVAQNDYWDEFAAGPYAVPATVPPVTWHP
jgi:uncharacterized lipoprotein YddW (UPF0748 family)